jgi:site-specific DNA-methyltransferase (adenine-specific)
MQKYLNTIINDDFRNHLDIFTQEAFVISDPPYNQKYHYFAYSDDMSIDEYGKMMADAFAGRKSVIISYPEETINVLGKLGDCSEVVSWVYNSNTAKQHRLISWWNCKPDMRKIGQPYKNPMDKRIKKRIDEGKQARLYDWWKINQVKNVSKKDNPHPCLIPYEIAQRIILLTTKEDDTIIDPFAGSGTVLKAAKDCGRNYIGFEIDKKYCDYAKTILKND